MSQIVQLAPHRKNATVAATASTAGLGVMPQRLHP
jgi:hypothetical protein